MDFRYEIHDVADEHLFASRTARHLLSKGLLARSSAKP